MYLASPDDSPSALRKSEMFLASVASSTKVSGHSPLINSSLGRSRPELSTSATSVSKTLGARDTAFPSRNNLRSAASRRNGPNSFECLCCSVITRSFQGYQPDIGLRRHVSKIDRPIVPRESRTAYVYVFVGDGYDLLILSCGGVQQKNLPLANKKQMSIVI